MVHLAALASARLDPPRPHKRNAGPPVLVSERRSPLGALSD